MPLNICAHRIGCKTANANVFYLDFSRQLTSRKGSVNFYAPDQYGAQEEDTILCREVLKSLLQEDSGVLQIGIHNGYRLCIHRSMAVSVSDIVARVKAAAKRAGTTAVEIQIRPNK